MKFGKQLKRGDPKYLNHCIAYDILKKAISVVVKEATQEDIREVKEAFEESTALSGASCQPADSRFVELLQHELVKVNRFTQLQLQTLFDAIREAQRPFLESDDKASSPSEEALSAVERLLDAAAEDLVSIEQFRRINFTGFRKIVKKFDKLTLAKDRKTSLSSWFIPRLFREYFIATPMDPHLAALAGGYALLRQHRRGLFQPQNISAETGDEKTSVFWLMPSARMLTLCKLVKRFELVLPHTGAGLDGERSVKAVAEQQRRLLYPTLLEDVTSIRSSAGATPGMFRKRHELGFGLSVECSMVYYDAPDFPEYAKRLQQQQACGFRSRRTLMRDEDNSCELIERDGCSSALGVHAFTSVTPLLAPDAFPFKHKAQSATESLVDHSHISEAARSTLLSVEKGVETHPTEWQKRLQDFAGEVASVAEDAALAPVVAIGSARLLLRGDTPATQGVSIALDEDVQFSHGPAGPAATAPSDTIDFPFCLLEVASRSADSAWLEELRSHAAVRSIAGFSIGAHAVAKLHPKAVPDMPPWYDHLASVETSAPPEAWGLMLEWRSALNETARNYEGLSEERYQIDNRSMRTASEDYLPPPDSSYASSLIETPHSGNHTRGASLQEERIPEGPLIEPKSYLASERTMLEWMHTILALGAVGIGLWKVSLNNVSNGASSLGYYSLLLVATAVVFTWYAVVMHLVRMKAIEEKRTTERLFNSPFGPLLFATILGIGLVAHLIGQLMPLFADVDYDIPAPVLNTSNASVPR